MSKKVKLLFILSMLCSQAYATISLRFIGDVNFSTGTTFQETEIGGLSGITYDKKQNKLLAISDDKSWVNETRFYELDLTLTPTEFKIVPSKIVKLKKENGKFFEKSEADFEGIALYNDDILISSEGSLKHSPPTSSALYRFSRNGELREMISIPKIFKIPEKGALDASGTRENKGFETLSTSLDGKTTFIGAEDALIQDGEIASLSNSSTTRIVIYKDLKPVKEVPYTVEKIESSKVNVGNESSDNGLVDIAAIDDKSFYSLERMWIPHINKNIIRIYNCQITKETTDISKIDSLKLQKFSPVKKTLVADLDDFISKMNIKLLDNIEGISFGPKLVNGSQTLILVSDNNFSQKQRTLFMAFEILEKRQ